MSNVPEGAREVSEEAFYRVIGPLDVSPSVRGPWPYLSIYKHRDGRHAGYSKEFLIDGCGSTEVRYFLP